MTIYDWIKLGEMKCVILFTENKYNYVDIWFILVHNTVKEENINVYKWSI